MEPDFRGSSEASGPAETYQGWTNRETWCVALWLNNEYGPYTMLLDDLAAEDDPDSPSHAEERLRDLVEEIYEMPETGLIADLVGYALRQVNWREIIDNAKER